MTIDEHRKRLLTMWGDKTSFGMSWKSIGEFVKCYNGNYRAYEKGFKDVNVEAK